MDKDDKLLINHFKDLSVRAGKSGYAAYSDFLGLNEINILQNNASLYSSKYILYGGYKDALRIMAAFVPEDNDDEIFFPIAYLKIEPAWKQNNIKLTHRDYLGSILGLGITRGKVGDIFVGDDASACAIVHESIAGYVIANLSRVGRCDVKCSYIEGGSFKALQKYEEKNLTISSARLDCVIAAVYNMPRSKATSVIGSGQCFVNGKEIMSTSKLLNGGDVVSVRHQGRFIYYSDNEMTRKNKLRATARIFK